MSLSELAVQFNLSKKVAQLVKVISFFTTQIEERRYQLNFLTEKFENNLKSAEENYEKVMNELQKAVAPIEPSVLSKLKVEYDMNYANLTKDFDNFRENIKMDTGQKVDEIIREISALTSEITEISTKLLQSQSGFANLSVRKHQQLEDEKNSEKYKKEIRNLEKESKLKYENYEKESKLKFAEMEENHKKEMLELRRQYSGDTTQFDLFHEFLKKAKENVNNKKKDAKSMKNEVEKLKESSFYQQMREDMSKEINNLSNDINNYKNKKEDLIKTIENNKNEYIENENKQRDELSALKASLEFKLQKMKKEIEELLKKLEEEFLKKTEDQRAQVAAMNKDFDSLLKQNEEELEKLRQKLKESEQNSERNIHSKEKLIEETMKYHTIELEKIERERESISSRNEKEFSNAQANMNRALENAKSRYELLLAQLRAEMEQSRNKGNKQLTEAQDNLANIRKQKEEAIKQKQAKLEKYDDETANIKKQREEENNKQLANFKASKDEEFKSKQTQNEELIKSTLEKNEKAKNDKINEYNKNYENTIKDIKEKGYDKTEYEQELAKFKKEYESLQEKLNQIQPPPANKNFALLDDEIKNKSKQIEDMINSNAIQKQAIINDWENAIEQENSRHKQATAKTSSGRNREQVKQALANQIQDVKNERIKEQERLSKILQQLNKESMDQMVDAYARKNEASSKDKIDALIRELDNERQRNQQQISEAQKQKENQINQANLNNETKKYEYENLSKEKKEEIDAENNKFVEKMRQVKQELSLVQKKAKERETELMMNHDTTCQQENQAFKYHSEKANEQIAALTESMRQKQDGRRSALASKAELNEKELARYEKDQRKALSCAMNDWKALQDFYNEKIEVLEEKLKEIIEKYNTRPPRQCDVEQIEKLTVQLQIVSTQLKNNAKDLVECRKLMIMREKEYNKKFGRQPHIGVMAFA